MVLSDYDAVISLWKNCNGVNLRDADSIDGIKRYLKRNPGLSFLAIDDDTLVGTIMAGHDAKRGYIQHLAVADSMRNAGIGAKLLELCLAALKAEGIVKSHVHVLGDNSLGRKFWVSRGWMRRADIAVYSFINGGSKNT
jgi:ribosomal protein S18 acetylase RimI-like enzyme